MKMLFLGRKETGAQALAWSMRLGYEVVGVLTDSHMPTSPTSDLARRHGLPLMTYDQASEAIAAGGLTFDVVVSFVYWKRIKEPLLSHPKAGVINFHPAPLPDYKGLAGYNFAIMDRLDRWAVSAHYVDEGIDTGRIIERFDFSIDPDDETALSLEKKSQDFLLALYKKVMRKVFEGRSLSTTANEGGRYFTRADMEDNKLIKAGDDVDRKIRAYWFPPYSGAQVTIDGQNYTLVNDRILREIASLIERKD